MARANLQAAGQILEVSGLPDALTVFSLSFWLKINSPGPMSLTLFSRTGMLIESAVIDSTVYSVAVNSADQGLTVPMDTWNHFIITSNAGTTNLYLDGILNPSLSLSMVDFGQNPLTIFSEFPGADLYIAEIGLWSRVLSPTEIYELSTKRHSPVISANESVAIWKLNGSDSLESDSSGNGYDLSANSTVPSDPPDHILDELSISLFSPHLVLPSVGSIFNRGVVNIEWEESTPPSLNTSIDTDYITYEIEYTDNFIGNKTVWRTLQRRIPWGTSTYSWMVGKMVKSKFVRLRIRAKDVLNETISDWSMSESFSVNVFDLVAPVIVSPTEDSVYTDFIYIAWDESQIKETYRQKIRYTVEYSSESQSINWTIVASNIPVGQNMVRWDISSVLPAEDYVIRLTARDVSTERSPSYTSVLSGSDCIEPTVPADQIAVAYVYSIKVRHSGMFIIDTVPPVARISIDGNTRHVSNAQRHTINIYAEDATTQVETVRLSNCDASNYLPLGRLDDVLLAEDVPEEQRCPISLLLNADEIPFSPKVDYELNAEESGFRKIQALLSDTGGNLSIQKPTRLFLPFFETGGQITDFIIYQKQQDTWSLGESLPPEIVSVSETYEIMCVVTDAGEVWILDPFPRLIYTLSQGIDKVFYYAGQLYFFTHATIQDGSDLVDLTQVWRESGNSVVLISPVKSDSNPTDHFQKDLAIVAAVWEYDGLMWTGFLNGELWTYNSISWVKKHTFDYPIKSITGDSKFLYVGFQNNDSVALYNGTSFYELVI